MIYRDTELISPWYENGFDFDYDRIPTLQVSFEQDELIIKADSIDIDERTVSEDYYRHSEGTTQVEKVTFSLPRVSDGHFSLHLPMRQTADDSVIYFVKYRNDAFVFRVTFKTLD